MLRMEKRVLSYKKASELSSITNSCNLINSLFGTYLSPNDLPTFLNNTAILCEILNKLSPQLVKFSNKPSVHARFYNFDAFLQGAKLLGIEDTDSLFSIDLLDPQNLYKIFYILDQLYLKFKHTLPTPNSTFSKIPPIMNILSYSSSSLYDVSSPEKSNSLLLQNSSLPNIFPISNSNPSLSNSKSLFFDHSDTFTCSIPLKSPLPLPSPILISNPQITSSSSHPVSPQIPSLKSRPRNFSLRKLNYSISSRKRSTSRFDQITQRLVLGNSIGKGNFGTVYKALNLENGEMVAVKQISLSSKSDSQLDDILKEVETLKSLSHPSIVKYYDCVLTMDHFFLVMEYIENGSLYSTLKAFGVFPEKLVLAYTTQILDGLAHLHSKNVVHCDLKAANILTTKQGTAKLADFGVSLNIGLLSNSINSTSVLIPGTPCWIAPEIIKLEGPSTKSDIWSLGCTIIELLTGKPPYIEMNSMAALYHIVEDTHPPLPENISPECTHFLLSCFIKSPKLRPSANDLLSSNWIKNSSSNKSELSSLLRSFSKRVSNKKQFLCSLQSQTGDFCSSLSILQTILPRSLKSSQLYHLKYSKLGTSKSRVKLDTLAIKKDVIVVHRDTSPVPSSAPIPSALYSLNTKPLSPTKPQPQEISNINLNADSVFDNKNTKTAFRLLHSSTDQLFSFNPETMSGHYKPLPESSIGTTPIPQSQSQSKSQTETQTETHVQVQSQSNSEIANNTNIVKRKLSIKSTKAAKPIERVGVSQSSSFGMLQKPVGPSNKRNITPTRKFSPLGNTLQQHNVPVTGMEYEKSGQGDPDQTKLENGFVLQIVDKSSSIGTTNVSLEPGNNQNLATKQKKDGIKALFGQYFGPKKRWWDVFKTKKHKTEALEEPVHSNFYNEQKNQSPSSPRHQDHKPVSNGKKLVRRASKSTEHSTSPKTKNVNTRSVSHTTMNDSFRGTKKKSNEPTKLEKSARSLSLYTNVNTQRDVHTMLKKDILHSDVVFFENLLFDADYLSADSRKHLESAGLLSNKSSFENSIEMKNVLRNSKMARKASLRPEDSPQINTFYSPNMAPKPGYSRSSRVGVPQMINAPRKGSAMRPVSAQPSASDFNHQHSIYSQRLVQSPPTPIHIQVGGSRSISTQLLQGPNKTDIFGSKEHKCSPLTNRYTPTVISSSDSTSVALNQHSTIKENNENNPDLQLVNDLQNKSKKFARFKKAQSCVQM
ncbi:hypothetical protein BB560_000797 [Smittium megazygosporum]|uniref:Protein kinase domain-containing protein n=1 Tax=Smittium megazygosporum TaxID=133381 RepID=A0A2T9ZJD1_9FUNG|nr:hypothetical protein BB560_000797 [Smittium megazygosporum]